MGQMTWRTSDELLEQVRRQALERGHSLNEWVTVVLAAASDPALAGDEAQQVRERLRRAGLLDDVDPLPRKRPETAAVERARVAAGRGTPLSDLVTEGRR